MKSIRLYSFALLVLVMGPLLSKGSGEMLAQSAFADTLPLVISAPNAGAIPQSETLFEDNFENGITRAWDVDTNWQIVQDGGSQVLEGQGHAWATLRSGSYWSDYTLKVNVKIISGALQLMFRMSDDRGRYILGVHPGGLYLQRESPWENISGNLATDSTGFATNTWYTLQIHAEGRHITVSVNGETLPRIDFSDNLGNTLWQGSIGLEVTAGELSQVRFDTLLITGVAPLSATWAKTGGPIGGLGYDVRYGSTDKSVMYVTDNYSGVNKSTDGGQTWFISNRGITGRSGPSLDAVPIFTLTVDPNNANIVWAGLKDAKGLYKSTNAGQTWQNVTPNIPEVQFVFRGVTIEPGHSNIVYAQGEIPTSLDGKSNKKALGRIYFSDDGGQTWKAIWDGNNLARYVIIHPNNPNIIYVSLGIFDREAYDSYCTQEPSLQGYGGVLKGVRNGANWTWTNLNNGLTDVSVGSLVVHPTNPDILLAGAGNVGCSPYKINGVNHLTGGVFRSENGGQSWTKTLAEEIITSVEFSTSAPNIAYAAGQNHFYISEDGGLTWDMVDGQSFPWGPPGVIAGFPIDILVDPDDPFTLFANNYGGGNVKSSDGGHNWTLASDGYTGALMFDISIDPQNPARIFAAARSGVFGSLDGGAHWAGLAYPPADVAEAYSVAVNPDNSQIVIVARDKLGSIFRSQDGGKTWSKVLQLDGGNVEPGNPLKQHSFKRIVFAPSNTKIVYGGSCRDDVRLGWNYTDSLGVYRSADGGKTWQEANDANIANHCINNLAVHPSAPNLVYAATAAGGVFKTLDGGQHWTHLPGLTPIDIRAIAVRPDQPGMVYVGTAGEGVYVYNEGSGTWQQIIAGMEPNDSIYALVFDPTNPEVIWAGSNKTGVYRWDPIQSLWVHVNAGLHTRAVTDLAISADGQVLYAATWGEGVFRLGEVNTEQMVFLPLVQR
jgi:photosystem II stability/assembly factor-like uncharacterized protein